jgi:hypothetical protein
MRRDCNNGGAHFRISRRSGPVAEELQVLTIFTDGCTDFLFDKAVPQPKAEILGNGNAMKV